ncbi:WD repeat-containing protein 70-like [Histomonas meleagridis]|uniref:WD repeat-containing protein 70-like n=1 Tax=Histomonas meleagridis TaxID=135588 RepID=UPI0035595256|nr:WD repeat-containing protein 70-like [Histomonas meleagridis]KAH0807126.1 WD repeat-containing protein 70-like [Histomonas meleagridis]
MDGYIRVYSITLCACVRIWKSSGKIPLSCRFSHNGKWIIVTCDDGLMDIIDVGDAKVIRSLIIDAYTIDACFSPNDRRFAVVDRTGGFSLWDVDDLGKESLTVLRIDNIEPFTVQYLENDEIRVVGKYSDKNYGNENY